MSVNLSIINRTRGAVDVRALRRHLVHALKLLGVRSAEWSITIVGDREMKALHDRAMGLGTTTDVLTFDLREGFGGKTAEGSAVELDTVICRDEAARRAKELCHSIAHELLLYAIHSVLHVQGYNDVGPRGAEKMHRREDAVLIALGVGAVFDPARRGDKIDQRNPRPKARK